MKINRNKVSLQSNFEKMLQAGKDNVDTSSETLHANTQSLNNNSQQVNESEQQEAETKQVNEPDQETVQNIEPVKEREVVVEPKPKRTAQAREKTQVRAAGRNYSANSARQQRNNYSDDAPRLNAAQRHEVPDRNAKYAGEPIKSVGCRMPQSLYARMLQYKAMNDTQLHRITLNDIIIEAVEKYMDENG